MILHLGQLESIASARLAMPACQQADAPFVTFVAGPTADFVTLADLEADGWTYRDVKRLCPFAADRLDSNGKPYWPADEVEPLYTMEVPA